jgi:5'-nucleotidase
VNFDADGNISNCNGTPHMLIGDNFTIAGRGVDAAQRTAIANDLAKGGVVRVVAPDAAATAVLAIARKGEPTGRQATRRSRAA